MIGALPTPSPGLYDPAPKEATYYISPIGSASSDGKSPLSPWNFDTLQSKVYEEVWQPGDRILFEGGQTISKAGYFYFEYYTIPYSDRPYTIGSYGGGKATLQCTASGEGGIYVRNLSVRIENLILKGNDYTTAGFGVILNGDTDNADFEYRNFQVVDCEIQDHLQGIRITAFAGTARVANCLIQSNKITRCRTQGITSVGTIPFLNQIFVRYNTISSVLGHSDGVTAGGDCILLGSIKNSLIEYNKADGAGGLANNRDFNLIWIYDAQNTTIRKNDAINAQGTGADCGAYGLDVNCINCVLEHNDASNCYGEFLFLGDGSNNIIRFNRSVNCNTQRATGVIYLYGGTGTSAGRPFVSNAKIYNNTFVCETSQANAVDVPTIVRNELATNTAIFANNLFEMKWLTARIINNLNINATNIKFYGNSYYNGAGPVTFRWGNTTYTSMKDWRDTVGQERLNSVDTGIRATAYLNPATRKLNNPSPIANKGINIETELGWSLGALDYYDQPTRANVIGADCSVVSVAPVLLIDEFANDAAFAFSLKKLRSNYTGFCVRLRRSDGVEQDFGFDANGIVDRAAIAAFKGALTVAGATWYDQSLRNYPAIQTTTGNQMVFDDPGVGVGLPQLRGAGDSKRFSITATGSNALIRNGTVNISGASALLTGSINAGQSSKVNFFSVSTNTATNSRLEMSGTATDLRVGGRRTDAQALQEITLTTSTTSIFGSVGTVNYSNATATIWKNAVATNATGAFQTTGSGSNSNSAATTIAALSNGTQSLNGGIAEWIIYPFTLSANEVERYLTVYSYHLTTP